MILPCRRTQRPDSAGYPPPPPEPPPDIGPESEYGTEELGTPDTGSS
jgi:hypothetical protein